MLPSKSGYNVIKYYLISLLFLLKLTDKKLQRHSIRENAVCHSGQEMVPVFEPHDREYSLKTALGQQVKAGLGDQLP